MYAPSAEAKIMEPAQNHASDVFRRIVTPYAPEAYEHFLKHFNLTEKYPNLVFNLQHGFPIGDIPPPTRTYIPKNHKSALEHIDVIRTYCQEEVALGRMSGPFTADEVFEILGGHFVSSPLGVVEKAGEPGKFRVVRDLSYQNPDGYSVNSLLDSDDFPTEWGTAAQVAEIVSALTYTKLHASALLLLHATALSPLHTTAFVLCTLRRLSFARFGALYFARFGVRLLHASASCIFDTSASHSLHATAF
jgi:hypothetical protein